jgi:hypothetical protein
MPSVVATPDALTTIVDPHVPHQLRDVAIVAVPLEIVSVNATVRAGRVCVKLPPGTSDVRPACVKEIPNPASLNCRFPGAVREELT